MKEVTTYVGIDAHKKDLFVAMLRGSESKPVTWQLSNEPNAVRRFVRKLEREAPGPVHVFYEAGACGYALQRQVTTTRVSCDVVAPALIPRKPGERVKTNRRDARKLAELGRAGLLTAVQPPTPEDELSETWHGRGTMPAKICSGAAIGWASCCCAVGCTIRAATGRARTDSGSTV
jgi:transposase